MIMVSAVMPSLKELRLDEALPSTERGPVENCALARLAVYSRRH
jgi:hypothetical protein